MKQTFFRAKRNIPLSPSRALISGPETKHSSDLNQTVFNTIEINHAYIYIIIKCHFIPDMVMMTQFYPLVHIPKHWGQKP